MSRSNNVEVKNPAKRFFQWSGGDGSVSYYDKELKEKVSVPLPFTFMVLDRLVTISGYSDEDGSGIWSNEIKNTKTDQLTVRTKNGVKKIGLYEEVKTVTGARFAQSLYIAFYDDAKKLQIGNFKLTGCAVSAWIEFSKGRDVYQGAISIAGREQGKKGATTFYSPVFEQKTNVSESSEEAATALDRELQEYLKAYFALRGEAYEQPETDMGLPEFPANPIAKSLAELITVKQLGMIRALARESGIDENEECKAVMNCHTDELSIKAADQFIKHLKTRTPEYSGSPQKAEAAAAGGNDYGSTYGDHVQPIEDGDIPF